MFHCTPSMAAMIHVMGSQDTKLASKAKMENLPEEKTDGFFFEVMCLRVIQGGEKRWP